MFIFVQMHLQKFIKIFFGLGVMVMGWGCGQQIPPTGGPRDSLPPKLVSSIPEYGIKNFKGDRITLTFDEYVTLDNPFEKITYSPIPKSNPNAEGRLKNVTIKIKDTLEENTTYNIDFGNSLKDINEGNILKDFSFVFSTGPYLDSAYLIGKVIVAETGNTDSTMIAVLHKNLDDSAVAKEKPRYYTRLKGDGSFLFRNIKAGTYRIFAIKDADGGKKYDQPSELIAFADQPVEMGKDTAIVLYAFAAEDETPVSKTPKPTAAAKKTDDKRLRFGNNLDLGKQDLLGPFTLKSEFPLNAFDSTGIILTDKDFNKIDKVSISLDPSGKEIFISHPWKENQEYKILLSKGFATDTMENKVMRADTIGFFSKKESDYGKLDIRIDNLDSTIRPVLQLLKNNKITHTEKLQKNRYQLNFMDPGEYKVLILFDKNGNGKWDTGNYWKKLQPEIVVSRKQNLQVRANWDNELRLDLKDLGSDK